MGYCQHIKAGGFHICASHQFNLWQQDIDQGDICDVHYWEVEADKAKAVIQDQQVTINLLKNQVAAYRKQMERDKNTAHAKGTAHTEWYEGPPPHIGWWCTCADTEMSYWRWWNGAVWSVAVEDTDTEANAVLLAYTPYRGGKAVWWSDYYPAYARAPRVNPNESTK
jgi:hypothetical protein